MRRLAHFLFDSLVILVAGAALSAWLLQSTPGASVDVRQLDPQYSQQTLDAMAAERQQQRSFTGRSGAWLLAILKGDLGRSELSGLPVAQLLRERGGVTAATMTLGAASGFAAGTLVAGSVVLLAPVMAEWIATAAFLALLSLPAGLLVLFAVFGRVPVEAAVGAVVAPRVYFYAARLFRQQKNAGWFLHGIASGIGPLRLALFQALPAIRSELSALLGFALITALAACIPAEVLSGQPGIGQLAWRSAMERDLPVVIGVTMTIALVSRAVTMLSAIPASSTSPESRWSA